MPCARGLHCFSRCGWWPAGWGGLATLALEAGVDIKIVSEQLGHSTTQITQDLYQHVRLQVQVDSAEQVVALLPGPKDAKETGS
jgi:integrase